MLPLQGIKVVEIAQNFAGPYASEILATLGADVVKVERPEGGDDARGWGPPFVDGSGVSFHAVNRNKRGITVDLKDPQALAWLRAYISQADVLVQNLRPGVMEELGLGAEQLRAANPRLVYCSLWAYGNRGPMRLSPGYEPIIQAFAGIFSVNGAPDGPPARVTMQILDLGTGLWAALGCVAALMQRQTTGQGAVVDASLFETALGLLQLPFAAYKRTGNLPQRHASGSNNVVIFQAFKTKDGEIVVAAANDRLFAKLAKEVGHPELATDERFKTNPLRVANRQILIPIFERLMLARGRDEWAAKFEAAGIPCSPIHDLADVAAHPQTQAVDIVEKVPDIGLEVIGLPISFDGVRPGVRSRAPGLGEHNAEIRD